MKREAGRGRGGGGGEGWRGGGGGMREEVSFPGLWLYQTVIRKDFKFKFSQMLCRESWSVLIH